MRAVFFFILPSVLLGFCAAQCDSGWARLEKTCYHFIQEPQAFFEALFACHHVRAQLVEIESATENDFVKNLSLSNGANRTWIGLEDFFEEGAYQWTNSMTKPGYQNWESGQPDNARHMEDCVAMQTDANGTWFDYYCEMLNPLVCEKRVSEDIIG